MNHQMTSVTLLLISSLISITYAAYGFGPAEVHQNNPNMCYNADNGNYFKPGQSWDLSGCGKSTCTLMNYTGEPQLMVTFESCGVVAVDPPCYLKEDKNAAYPACCPQPVCPEGDTSGDLSENDVDSSSQQMDDLDRLMMARNDENDDLNVDVDDDVDVDVKEDVPARQQHGSSSSSSSSSSWSSGYSPFDVSIYQVQNQGNDLYYDGHVQQGSGGSHSSFGPVASSSRSQFQLQSLDEEFDQVLNRLNVDDDGDYFLFREYRRPQPPPPSSNTIKINRRFSPRLSWSLIDDDYYNYRGSSGWF